MQDETRPEIPSAYLARLHRLKAAAGLRRSDRVPLAPSVHYYPSAIRGISNRTVHYDRTVRSRLWRETTIEHDWDAAPSLAHLIDGRTLELVGATQFVWAGRGLSENQPFQYVEREYMLQDEYDDMLRDPERFTVRKLWPRAATSLAPLAALAGGPQVPLLLSGDSRGVSMFLGGVAAAPGMEELLETLIALAKETRAAGGAMDAYRQEMAALGYPLLAEGMGLTAFDYISDHLRGLRGTMLDMFQVPDKLLAAIEMIIPWSIEQAIGMTRAMGHDTVFIPLHRGAAGFMSNEQFARFYWPGLEALLLALIDAGLTPAPFFEGDYTPRLEFLQQLPPGRIIGHFDRIDRAKAKAMIGDVMCFMGNVPPSLLHGGTPAQIKADVRELIELFADNGGLIVEGSCGIPDEAPRENVHALTEAVHEYGVL